MARYSMVQFLKSQCVQSKTLIIMPSHCFVLFYCDSFTFIIFHHKKSNTCLTLSSVTSWAMMIATRYTTEHTLWPSHEFHHSNGSHHNHCYVQFDKFVYQLQNGARYSCNYSNARRHWLQQRHKMFQWEHDCLDSKTGSQFLAINKWK